MQDNCCRCQGYSAQILRCSIAHVCSVRWPVRLFLLDVHQLRVHLTRLECMKNPSHRSMPFPLSGSDTYSTRSPQDKPWSVRKVRAPSSFTLRSALLRPSGGVDTCSSALLSFEATGRASCTNSLSTVCLSLQSSKSLACLPLFSSSSFLAVSSVPVSEQVRAVLSVLCVGCP